MNILKRKLVVRSLLELESSVAYISENKEIPWVSFDYDLDHRRVIDWSLIREAYRAAFISQAVSVMESESGNGNDGVNEPDSIMRDGIEYGRKRLFTFKVYVPCHYNQEPFCVGNMKVVSKSPGKLRLLGRIEEHVDELICEIFGDGHSHVLAMPELVVEEI